MANSEKRQSADDRRIDEVDRADHISDSEDAVNVSASCGETSVGGSQSVTRRLADIFVEDGDEDLLMQRSDRKDGGVLQWFRALDMQVMGACRADERLKPLLKMNGSSDVAEDRLLAHLSQHFEPSEVGLLARCLCIPLVSIRVGKINKQGALLSPTPIRGNLCLALLPTSDLRILFNGDDGSMERVATLSNVPQCVDVEIEDLSADKSGRSFVIKTSDCLASYFWCSEKSTVHGKKLLRKMKDLLVMKPTLAELTGITEPRLNCFASHLRAYLTGSVVTSAPDCILLATPTDDSTDSSEIHFPKSSFNCQKSSRVRQLGIQGSKTNLIYQGSLSPRSSSFKESLQKNLSSIRSAAREKLRRRGENYFSCADSLSLASSNTIAPSNPNSFLRDKLPEVSENTFAALSFLDVYGKSAEFPVSSSEIEVPLSVPSPLSPHYCWCPPVASALQYARGNPQLPISSSESFSLPPLSSLLSSGGASSLLTSKPLLNLSDVPPLDFPSFLPDTLLRRPTSQQIPTFTMPFICDPIVHIPVIDVCSSGQGYLVSAGPAMSTSIPPLNPNLVDPLLPNTESVVEKGARETLRMLISSSNQPQLLEVFPSVLSSKNEMQNVFSVGSRGLYSGTRDVDAITNSRSTPGLVLLSEKSVWGGIGKKCAGGDDSTDHKEKSSSSDPSGVDEGIDFDR